MKGDLYSAALWAGLASGILSGFPLLSLGNCLCCLWIVGGGVFAAYLYQRNSSEKLTSSDGMKAGALAGFLAAMVATLMDLVFSYWTRDLLIRFMEAYGMEPSTFMNYQHYFTARGFASTLLMRLIIFSLFAAIGGALGTALFKPKAYGHN